MTNNKPVPVEDFCFGIIKHDALEIAGAKDLILERLGMARLTVCAEKLITISEEQIDTIYQDIAGMPYYPLMKKAMTGKDALCLVIGGDVGIADILQQLKGKPDRPGTIRGDLSYFHQMSVAQYQAYLSGVYTHHTVTGRPIYDYVKVDSRFHSSGAYEESRRGILAVFSDSEIKAIAEKYPAFADFMSKK